MSRTRRCFVQYSEHSDCPGTMSVMKQEMQHDRKTCVVVDEAEAAMRSVDTAASVAVQLT